MYKLINTTRLPEDYEDVIDFKLEDYITFQIFEDFEKALKNYNYEFGLFLKNYLSKEHGNFEVKEYYLGKYFYIRPELLKL